MSRDIQDSRMADLLSESELWEYLHFHGETQDFLNWVEGYRQNIEDGNQKEW